jgi:ATP-binding cassette, subfamily G (WHITE), member 1
MGPSGCGKSSLLNILSGFVQTDISGSIKVNGKERNDDSFRKQSTFIMQEENLHSLLTVRESMTFAVKLKTGKSLTNDQQGAKIVTILKTLNLDNHMSTLAGRLSGGQRKRLSIALELVDDPSIILLDEPTTGLDSSSSTQCIELLKNLALEGKTIICTIHTPSALILKLFDQIYAMAEGCCIYSGSSENLVPFLKNLDLVCPETYNPADFLLEIATNDYGPLNQRLTAAIKNGKNEDQRKIEKNLDYEGRCNRKKNNQKSASFFYQFNQLMIRNFLILKKDYTLIVLRFLVSIVVGIIVGGLYLGNGNEGDQIFSVLKYIFVSVFFVKYTSYYSLQTSCKLFHGQ